MDFSQLGERVWTSSADARYPANRVDQTGRRMVPRPHPLPTNGPGCSQKTKPGTKSGARVRLCAENLNSIPAPASPCGGLRRTQRTRNENRTRSLAQYAINVGAEQCAHAEISSLRPHKDQIDFMFSSVREHFLIGFAPSDRVHNPAPQI